MSQVNHENNSSDPEIVLAVKLTQTGEPERILINSNHISNSTIRQNIHGHHQNTWVENSYKIMKSTLNFLKIISIIILFCGIFYYMAFMYTKDSHLNLTQIVQDQLFNKSQKEFGNQNFMSIEQIRNKIDQNKAQKVTTIQKAQSDQQTTVTEKSTKIIA